MWLAPLPAILHLWHRANAADVAIGVVLNDANGPINQWQEAGCGQLALTSLHQFEYLGALVVRLGVDANDGVGLRHVPAVLALGSLQLPLVGQLFDVHQQVLMVLAVDVHMHAHDLYRHGLLLATGADDGVLHGFQRVRSLSDVQFHSPFVSWTTTFCWNAPMNLG